MPNQRKTRASEEGFVLIGVLFLVVVILIGLAIAAPKIATQIRRDKELELYHRGMQYTRAIRMYYKKFGSYPISLDQLENSNNIRFLRRRYKDPFTGKADWRLIHLGEAKVAPTGLFGQPLGATGANGSGANGQTSPGFNGNGQGAGNPGSSNFSNSFSNGSGTGGFGSGGSSPGGGPGLSSNSTAPTDPSSGTASGGSGATSSGTNGSSFGSNTGGAAGLGTSTLKSSNGSPIGSTGPIVGVASSVAKESIRQLKKQKHYNEWEFVYNPQADLGGLGGNTGAGVVPQNGTNTGFGNPGLGNGPGFGSNPGSSLGGGSSGVNGGSGNSPAPPTTPPANPNPAPPVQNDPPTQ